MPVNIRFYSVFNIPCADPVCGTEIRSLFTVSALYPRTRIGRTYTPFRCVRSPRALAEGIVCLATANRGNDNSPTGVPPYPLVNFAYSYTPKCGA